MVIALVNGERLRAEDAGTGTIGICPWTGANVRANVGEIRQFWSYIGDHPPLPEGYENETEWHYNWKFPIKDDFCEVVCGENNEHRADIIGNNETVVEIQNSPIDIRIVRERTLFYKNFTNKRVIWLVNATEYWSKRLKVDFNKREGNKYPITWSPIRKWVIEIAKSTNTNLFLDYNFNSDKLLQMWVHDGKLWGIFIMKVEFFRRYCLENAKDEYRNNPDDILNLWRNND